jgi:hypothetical protein
VRLALSGYYLPDKIKPCRTMCTLSSHLRGARTCARRKNCYHLLRLDRNGNRPGHFVQNNRIPGTGVSDGPAISGWCPFLDFGKTVTVYRFSQAQETATRWDTTSDAGGLSDSNWQLRRLVRSVLQDIRKLSYRLGKLTRSNV